MTYVRRYVYTQYCECVVECVGTSYNKLWKLLIDRDMKKRDLCEKAEVSATSLAKLDKGENVNTDIMVKTCHALECDLGDIVEIVPENNDGSAKATRQEKSEL